MLEVTPGSVFFAGCYSEPPEPHTTFDLRPQSNCYSVTQLPKLDAPEASVNGTPSFLWAISIDLKCYLFASDAKLIFSSMTSELHLLCVPTHRSKSWIIFFF